GPTSTADRDASVKLELSKSLAGGLEAYTGPPTVTVLYRGYYRGQVPECGVKVDLKAMPDLIVTRPPPPEGAAIAVRADNDLNRGAIAIVLDCSGSMGGPLNANDLEKGKALPDNARIKLAIRALEETLNLVPEGTQISIRVFSDRESGPDKN